MLTQQPVSVPHISTVTGPETPDDPLDWARALILKPAAVSHEEERTRIGQLKGKERFDYARKLLEHWRAAPPAPPLADPDKVRARAVWLAQQHALCTYKDPDLPADERLRRAWGILHEIDAAGWKEPETLGLAGAIHKRWWELNARRHHLDQSLAWYTKGYEGGIGDGYTALNAAFVLDLLAGLQSEDARATGQPDASAREKRAKAISIRTEITDALDVPEVREKYQGSWWYCATLAEAYFGRGEYAKAREWLECGAAANPAPWERESAARQIARIYLLRTGDSVTGAESTAAWTALAALYGGQKEAVRTAFTGKVGLALSGGGLRASLFHLGVLARMAEADVLRHVEVISCVSGGSIVGMHYYLALKEMLERTLDGELTREHYVDLVRRVAATFTQGVQRNLRMEMLGSPLANLRMAWSGRSSRTRRLAELYERKLFALVQPKLRKRRVAMSDLRIFPGGAPADFKPRTHNWERVNKVPVLVVNATTLNTGHNWQFTAAWMGEPPGPIDSDVDGNDWLRRMPYGQAPEAHREVPVGDAVAASACVPALFEPLDLPGLFERRTVRLVDGGAHDNQGLASLLEQECTVIVVSDASGQMTSQLDPGSHGTLPAMRTNTILQARVRQAQHGELEARRRAGQLRGVAFLHLLRGIPPLAVDWVNCQEPEEKFGDRARKVPDTTEYGIPSEVQRCLAGLRTDLDAFHLAEAYALMTSGYRMAARYLPDAFPDAPRAGENAERWFFQEVDGVIADPTDARHARLMKLLEAGSSVAGKAWKVAPAAAWGLTVPVLLVLAVILFPSLLAQVGLDAIAPVVRKVGDVLGWGLVLALAGYALGHIPAARGIGRIPAQVGGAVTGVLGFLVAKAYLTFLNPAYLRAGRLGMRAPWDREPRRK